MCCGNNIEQHPRSDSSRNGPDWRRLNQWLCSKLVANLQGRMLLGNVVTISSDFVKIPLNLWINFQMLESSRPAALSTFRIRANGFSPTFSIARIIKWRARGRAGRITGQTLGICRTTTVVRYFNTHEVSNRLIATHRTASLGQYMHISTMNSFRWPENVVWI